MSNIMSDNEKTIWNFLKAKSLNDYAVAGIIGNLYAESGLNPQNLQNEGNSKLGMSDAEFTNAYDNGKYTNFVNDSYGYGLAQWTFWKRKQALADFAKERGKSIGDLAMQLDFLWKELQGYTDVMKVLNAANSVRAVSDVILTGFEKPAEQGIAMQEKRAGYGQTFYNKYASENKDSTVVSTPITPTTKSVDEIAQEVIKGLWSNGDARKKLLTEAGYDYNTVQAKVNALLSVTELKSNEEIAREVIAGKWGNGDARKIALTNAGYDYNTIQSLVNKMLKG